MLAAAVATVVLHGSLTGADNQTYRLAPFDVPAGTSRVTVDFDYTTRDQRTTIDLGLLDPSGLRGWSGGNKRHFTLSATDATPSYLPGPIAAGRWNLLLGIPNIRADTRAEYTATIRFDAAEPALRNGAGWYRGDLHMHTGHSDGSCASQRGERVPCPLFLTAQAASARGLDFIAITDHNTTSHADAIRELQPYFDTVLMIPGREITTFRGHANLFGSVAPLDFRATDWLAQVPETAAVSINHPIRPSGEDCMGCGWTADVDYARIQAVEAVNGADAETPFSGIAFWQKLLDRGLHVTGIGGSDNHNATTSTIGTPTTVIHADELSESGIVAGLKRGRVFIDIAGTRDRALDFSATLGDQTAQMGDTLKTRRGATVRFAGRVEAVRGGEAQLIVDGQRVRSARVDRVDFEWRADGKPHWARLDVRDADGHLALVGNPIYLR